MSYKFDNESSSNQLKIESSGDSINDIKFDPVENTPNNTIEEITEEDEAGINFLTNENKRLPEKEIQEEEEQSQYNFNEEVEEDEDNDPFMNQRYANNNNNEEEEEPRLSYDEIQQQKAYFLSQLKRLTERGITPSRKFGPEFPLNEIKAEVLRLRKEIEINRGVNYCKQGLLFCVSTIELLNTKYDPFGVDLDGWSTSIMADKESYNDVFEELYEKYSNKITMSPEIKLISMIAGSAMMFHLQKTMMNSQMNSGGGFLGNLMSKFSGGEPEKKQKQQQQKESKMKGPSIDTDDLLKKLNNDEFSDASSVMSEEITFNKQKEKKITVPKKRGRKPKNN